MSGILAAFLKYSKAVLCSCKWGYEELQGINQQAQLNYEEVKTNMDKCNADWRTLHEETKKTLESVIKEYRPYIDEEVTDKDGVVKRSEQLSVEFEELRKRYSLKINFKHIYENQSVQNPGFVLIKCISK